jgi:hypothetical protein
MSRPFSSDSTDTGEMHGPDLYLPPQFSIGVALHNYFGSLVNVVKLDDFAVLRPADDSLARPAVRLFM